MPTTPDLDWEARDRFTAALCEAHAADSDTFCAALLTMDPEDFWVTIGALSHTTRVGVAIDMYHHLQARGLVSSAMSWQAILSRWERRLAALAA